MPSMTMRRYTLIAATGLVLCVGVPAQSFAAPRDTESTAIQPAPRPVTPVQPLIANLACEVQYGGERSRAYLTNNGPTALPKGSRLEVVWKAATGAQIGGNAGVYRKIYSNWKTLESDLPAGGTTLIDNREGVMVSCKVTLKYLAE